MDQAKPSLDLLRSVTDELVLRALMDQRRLTRAELATHVGISKPTASQSVRRLTGAGLLRDTGERTTGRGRVGSYYALADDVGSALVVSVAPEGVVAETITVHGDVIARAECDVQRPARPRQVAAAIQAVARRAVTRQNVTRQAIAGREPPGPTGPVRLAVVTAADPVDRTTGRLVHLPDTPFLLGELDPADALSGLVEGPVLVDNDVNWAAKAEREAAAADGGRCLDDFAYLYLGEGVGCAIVSDGQVRRGHSGMTGEIAHVLTTGPRGRAVPFTEIFRALGLRRPQSTAVDVDALITAVTGPGHGAAATRTVLARAVSGVLAAVVALTDPQTVVIGGSWGCHPVVMDSIRHEFQYLPRHVPLRPAAVTAEPSLTGARTEAVRALQAAVTERARR